VESLAKVGPLAAWVVAPVGESVAWVVVLVSPPLPQAASSRDPAPTIETRAALSRIEPRPGRVLHPGLLGPGGDVGSSMLERVT
jgi:hypothetical protein